MTREKSLCGAAASPVQRGAVRSRARRPSSGEKSGASNSFGQGLVFRLRQEYEDDEADDVKEAHEQNSHAEIKVRDSLEPGHEPEEYRRGEQSAAIETETRAGAAQPRREQLR